MLVQVRQPPDGGGAAAAGGGRRAARGRLQPVPAVQLHHLRQQHARHLQVNTHSGKPPLQLKLSFGKLVEKMEN